MEYPQSKEESKEESKGPYFEGQKPGQCGHYYPDVLRWGDEKGKYGYYRILTCKFCGFFTEVMSDELIKRIGTHNFKILEEKGFLAGVAINEDLNQLRSYELKRLKKIQ